MMKCPICGTEIPAGSLYCEKCGEDIHIVPDFEPAVEFNIEQSINGIVEDINGTDEKTEQWEQEQSQAIAKRHTGHLKWVVVGFCITLFLFTAIAGILMYRYNSVSIQVQSAEYCVNKGQYDKAIDCYMRALEIDTGENDIGIKFALADVYLQKNNKIEYEYLIRNIARNENASEEQAESAYGKLIAIYREREDYNSINDLLLGSDNEQIVNKYRNYMALPPEFSIKEGYYTDIQPLKLSAYGNGEIYYTLDGSSPNERSSQYIAPIILDDGDYTVSAYFVNEYGIASEYVSKTYHIEIEALPIPEVSAVSGDYEFPTNIEILGDNKEVYYTTDGSEPSLSSTRYAGPIPMPLGKTNFKFVRLDSGRTSDIVERTYSLVMNTQYTPEEAVEDVVSYCISSGKIRDKVGHFDDSQSAYKYQYQYATNISRIDDFYVISEILRDEEGVLTKTGSHFAVNAYTKELFKLQIEGYNNYTLVEVEQQPTQ